MRKFYLTEANITYDVTAEGLLSLSLSDDEIIFHSEERTDGILRFEIDTHEMCENNTNQIQINGRFMGTDDAPSPIVPMDTSVGQADFELKPLSTALMTQRRFGEGAYGQLLTRLLRRARA